MQIDSFTLLLAGVVVKTALGILFLAFWLHDRRASWYGWWSGTYFLGALAAVVFLLRGFEATLLAAGGGVGALIAAFGLCWQGARAFDRRRPLLLPVLLALGFWLALCLLPSFVDSLAYRVVVSSLLASALLAMTAFEFWRGRGERLLSRWPVIVLFATLSLVFASRGVLVNLLPFPFGALPAQPTAVAAFNMIVFLHALVLTVLLVALTKERLELHQRNKAQTDPLTGALNRRALMALGERMLLRHAYENSPLCLLFLDLDHFKALNDRFGHSGGDDVLTKFVAVVHNSLRPTDFLFRLGGEEFCCLLPHTSADQAQRAAERIRQQVENTTVDVAGTAVRTTVSLGIASTEVFGYDLDMLMRRADLGVYAAKRQGRNQVVIAKDDEAAGPVRGMTAAAGIAAAR
jgi:diguanylate cyclase (GGDEF)-like protein